MVGLTTGAGCSSSYMYFLVNSALVREDEPEIKYVDLREESSVGADS